MAEEKQKKPIYKKWWFWVLAVLILGAIASSGNKGTSTNTASNSSTQPQASSQPAAQATEAAKKYTVGHAIQFRNHTLTVNSVKRNWQSNNQFIKPDSSENQYVLLNVTINNTGSDSLPVNTFGFKLEDDSGTQRNNTYANEDATLSSVTVSPGGKTTGNIVFEAKKDSSKLILHYNPGIGGGEEVSVEL